MQAYNLVTISEIPASFGTYRKHFQQLSYPRPPARAKNQSPTPEVGLVPFLISPPWPTGSQPSNRASRLRSLLIISMGRSAAAPNRFFCQSALEVVVDRF